MIFWKPPLPSGATGLVGVDDHLAGQPPAASLLPMLPVPMVATVLSEIVTVAIFRDVVPAC
jgi:hypothetical protein